MPNGNPPLYVFFPLANLEITGALKAARHDHTMRACYLGGANGVAVFNLEMTRTNREYSHVTDLYCRMTRPDLETLTYCIVGTDGKDDLPERYQEISVLKMRSITQLKFG